MKLRNRLLALLMVLAMLMGSVAVYAEDAAVATGAEAVETGTKMPAENEKLYGKLSLLEALGLFDDMNALELDAPVTRATYAGWLEKVANLTGEKPYATTEFSDVPVEHEQYAAVQNVVAAGYMSGMGGSVFMPSATISLTDAAVALVRLTGKEAYANLKGGYPTGYEVTARSIGLYDGVKYGVNTTVNVLVMIYNALRADYLAADGLSSKGIIYVTGDSVLSFFHNIYEVEGTMTGNGFTKTYNDAVILNPDSVEIDKNVYDCENSKLHDLIGKYVQGFYRYDKEAGTRELISAYADENDNTIFELSSRALSTGGYNLRLSGLTLYYPIDEDGREKKIELTPGFEFIYNNRSVPTRLDSDILLADGELTFIDKNNDRKYDTVIAKERVTEKVTGIDQNNTVLYTDTMAIQKGEQEGSVLIIKKKEKKSDVISEVTVDEITVGSVVTSYRSKDGLYNEVIISQDSTIVTPASVGEDDRLYAVDDTAYEFANISARKDVISGMATELLFDYLGRIAYVTKSGNYDYTYGFVFKVYEDHELESIAIKLLTKDGQKKYKVRPKVMIDGEGNCNAEALLTLVNEREMIRFRLDSDEVIRSVDTERFVMGSPGASPDNKNRHDCLEQLLINDSYGAQALRYNRDGESLGFNAEYMKARHTFCLTTPTDEKEREKPEKYLAYIAAGETSSTRKFKIYDWNPDTLEVGVMMEIVATSKAQEVSLLSASAVVVKKYRIWEDDEDVLKLDVVDGGKEKTYIIPNEVASKFDMVGFGDVIRYELDAQGRLGNIQILFNASEKTGKEGVLKIASAEGSDWRYDYGRVYKKFTNYVIIKDALTGEIKGSVPIGSVSELTFVDMTERTVLPTEKQYFSTSIENASSPSYIYSTIYKNAESREMVIYKY